MLIGCSISIVLAVCLIAGIVVVLANGNKASQVSVGTTWQTFKTWQGSEDQQTESFTMVAEWRVIWSDTITSDFGGAFTLTIYNSDEQPVQLVAATQKSNPDTTYNVHASPGGFYLKFGTANVTYKVAVQVLK